jgi:tetraacyldisaccharide 4'-kinase
MKGEEYWRTVVSGERRGIVPRLLMVFLRALSFPYALILRFRVWGYAVALFRSRHLSHPVISVGNLAVGGTGKTPMTALIARRLMAQGVRVAVLSRGYGGGYGGAPRIVSDGETVFMTAAEAGDEPYLLARDLPGLMVVVGVDRYQAGQFAERVLHPDCFLLDDGFQHLRLWRELNILLLDCANPLGNGRILPAGPLREPTSAMGRADLIVLTRCEDGESWPQAGPARVPVLFARHRLVGVVPLAGGDCRSFSTLYGERIMAFAGIADPGRFFSALTETGLNVVGILPLPDHALYDDLTLAGIRRIFGNTGATCLVTTGKDAVKLEQRRRQLGRVWVAQLEMDLADPTLLDLKLESLFHKNGKSA